MNRQERRAVERKQARVPMVKMGLLTLAEAEVVAEALDDYARHLVEDTEGVLTGEQVWAVGRAKAIRDLLQASLEARPAHDGTNDRTPPA